MHITKNLTFFSILSVNKGQLVYSPCICEWNKINPLSSLHRIANIFAMLRARLSTLGVHMAEFPSYINRSLKMLQQAPSRSRRRTLETGANHSLQTPSTASGCGIFWCEPIYALLQLEVGLYLLVLSSKGQSIRKGAFVPLFSRSTWVILLCISCIFPGKILDCPLCSAFLALRKAVRHYSHRYKASYIAH